MNVIVNINKEHYDNLVYMNNTRPADLKPIERIVAKGTPLNEYEVCEERSKGKCPFYAS